MDDRFKTESVIGMGQNMQKGDVFRHCSHYSAGVLDCCVGKSVMESIRKLVMIAASLGVFSLNAAICNADSLTLSDIRHGALEPEGSEAFAFCRGYVAALVEGMIVKRYQIVSLPQRLSTGFTASWTPSRSIEITC